MMKISFIVPVYNVELYLEECLNSLVNQTYNNIEIIVVNDGSTDSSLLILKKYAEKDRRIVLIDKKNGGLSTARNTGLIYATGEYIFFVDSDDYIPLDSAEKISKTIGNNNNIDIITFSWCYVYSNKMCKIDNLNINGKYVGKDFMISAMTSGQFRASVCCKVFSRFFLSQYQIEFIPGILYEDLFYSIKSFLNAKCIISIPDCLYYYRRDNIQSITNTISSKDIDILKTIELAHSLLLQSQNLDILNSPIWQAFMFKWVANATFFKYPITAFFSRTGWSNCRTIKANKFFYSYIKSTTKYAESRNLRIASSLIKFNLFIFYILRKLSKTVFPNHNF